ncbi:type II secretion system F family protein [Candidatus Mancarchaeum acidiphilum]|uniref:type II secretion system F family protein n=1 Tax=Candidatus Mancarchaeum acidiphilum TaxID=1920749 RepID=UPI0012FFA4E7|nr:type II secretion system F family protein [Candidatus Mancarchaeum acidiphilum]
MYYKDNNKGNAQNNDPNTNATQMPNPTQSNSYQVPAGGIGGTPEDESRRRVRRDTASFQRPSRIDLYLQGVAAKHKGLEQSLKEQGINESVTSFLKRMLFASVIVAVSIGVVGFILFLHLGLVIAFAALVGIVVGVAAFQFSFKAFINYPSKKKVSNGKDIERNILFASRDLIISLRSGMPLFNAMVSISSGYGAASREFAHVVEKVQFGESLEQAIDDTASESKSASFRKLMIQASVSIKAGSNIVDSLQEIVDDLSRERVIQLHAYGQKLNAIAMFYMLFGVILPSMGIAVVTILTTFIALIVVTPELLYGVLVGIIFLQVVFLQMIRSSRPIFTM